ncbi:MAG TPA: hypothetical protein DCM49_08345 [Lachnospiraceae bacterium]|nr:hypothetical protein [Lachnospiraceae bacterium]
MLRVSLPSVLVSEKISVRARVPSPPATRLLFKNSISLLLYSYMPPTQSTMTMFRRTLERLVKDALRLIE